MWYRGEQNVNNEGEHVICPNSLHAVNIARLLQNLMHLINKKQQLLQMGTEGIGSV